MICVIGDMLAVGVEVIVAPLGFSVIMLFVRCCVRSNFETIPILLAFKDKSIFVLHAITTDH
jgi:hypothetical protein